MALKDTLQFTGSLTVTSCWCGIRLAIPDSLYREAHDNGMSIHCPLGHSFVFTKTRVSELEDKIKNLERAKKWEREWRIEAEAQAATERRRTAAYKGHLTRARNKLAEGVCPVTGCTQHFSNVREHMKFKHPEWATEHGLAAELGLEA